MSFQQRRFAVGFWAFLFFLLISHCTLVFAQKPEEGTAELQLLLLKMPAELASALEKRVLEGGAAAEQTVLRLPDLIKQGQVRQLGFWKHEAEPGESYKWDLGNVGTYAEGEGKFVDMNAMGCHLNIFTQRYVTYAGVQISDERSRHGQMDSKLLYSEGSVNTMAYIAHNQWHVMYSRPIDSSSVVCLAKYVPLTNPQVPFKSSERSGFFHFKICELDQIIRSREGSDFLSGPEVAGIMAGAKVLYQFSCSAPVDYKAGTSNWRQPVKSKSGDSVASGYQISFRPIFSHDQTKVAYGLELSFQQAYGAKMLRAGYAGWPIMPVGEDCLVPLKLEEGAVVKQIVLVIHADQDFSYMLPVRELSVITPPDLLNQMRLAVGETIKPPSAETWQSWDRTELRKKLNDFGLKLPDSVFVIYEPADPSLGLGGEGLGHLREDLRKIMEDHKLIVPMN